MRPTLGITDLYIKKEEKLFFHLKVAINFESVKGIENSDIKKYFV